jgi:choline dehydrogenase
MGKVLAGEIPSTSFRFTQNFLSHPDDVTAAIACVELCREIGNSKPLQPFTRREVMPGNLKGAAFETFVRDGAESYFHETCTAKMGRDAMSVVNGNLKVYGSKIFASRTVRSCHACPGNTMAPCVIVGERASEFLRAAHTNFHPRCVFRSAIGTHEWLIYRKYLSSRTHLFHKQKRLSVGAPKAFSY